MAFPRRKYDSAFKLNAVLLCEEPDRSISDVSRELGVHENILYRWHKQYLDKGENAFPGNGRVTNLSPEQRRIRDLERRLAVVTMERDILKKAVAVFSREAR